MKENLRGRRKSQKLKIESRERRCIRKGDRGGGASMSLQS
jgi:hypothetical protein